MKTTFWKITNGALLVALLVSVGFMEFRFRRARHQYEWRHARDAEGVRWLAEQVAERDVKAGSATILGGSMFGPDPLTYGWPHVDVSGCFPRPFADGEFIRAYNQYLEHHPRTNSSINSVQPTAGRSAPSGG